MQDEFALFITYIGLYPTVIFTGLVIFVTLYWIISLLGMASMDAVDIGDFGDVGDVSDMGDSGDLDVSSSSAGFFSSIILKFGLYGVPLIVILSLISLIGWVLSYIYTSFLHQRLSSGLLYYVFGTGAFILVLVVSMWLTGIIISPIRKSAAQKPKRNASSNLGKIAVVRTLNVTDTHGEAELSDGGAGLILKIRPDPTNNQTIQRGDKVVLTEYMDTINAYKVVLVEDK